MLTWPGLRAGQSILIYGASGSIGTAGVQLAKRTGADVTAVCNTENIEVVRSLGADAVIDYTVADFAANGQTYDVVFDAVGKKSFRQCEGSLKDGGSYVSTDLGPYSQNVPLMLWTRFVGSKKAMRPIPRYTKDKVIRIKELIEAGAYRAVIDRGYPLEEAANATRYVETEQMTLGRGQACPESAVTRGAHITPAPNVVLPAARRRTDRRIWRRPATERGPPNDRSGAPVSGCRSRADRTASQHASVS